MRSGLNVLHIYLVPTGSSCKRKIVVRETPMSESSAAALRSGSSVAFAAGANATFNSVEQTRILTALPGINGVHSCSPGAHYFAVTAVNASYWEVIGRGIQQFIAGMSGLDIDKVHVHELSAVA